MWPWPFNTHQSSFHTPLCWHLTGGMSTIDHRLNTLNRPLSNCPWPPCREVASVLSMLCPSFSSRYPHPVFQLSTRHVDKCVRWQLQSWLFTKTICVERSFHFLGAVVKQVGHSRTVSFVFLIYAINMNSEQLCGGWIALSHHSGAFSLTPALGRVSFCVKLLIYLIQ